MTEFLENPMWGIAVIVLGIAVCGTVYWMNVDPALDAMAICARMDGEGQIACFDAAARISERTDQ